MSESAGTPWTTLEIEAAVAGYLGMLHAELTGNSVVKAEHNRMLQAQIGRSKGSIEYKHQNISAVLENLVCPTSRVQACNALSESFLIYRILRFLYKICL